MVVPLVSFVELLVFSGIPEVVVVHWNTVPLQYGLCFALYDVRHS
jgi:hypothetical protein